jgi:hypothetical protein
LLLFGELETEFLFSWEWKQSGCFDFGRTGLAFNLCDDVILECIVAEVIPIYLSKNYLSFLFFLHSFGLAF